MVVFRVVSRRDGGTFTRQPASATKCTYSAVVVIEQGLTTPTVNCTAQRYKCLTRLTTRGPSLKQSATYHVDDAPTRHVCARFNCNCVKLYPCERGQSHWKLSQVLKWKNYNIIFVHCRVRACKEASRTRQTYQNRAKSLCTVCTWITWIGWLPSSVLWRCWLGGRPVKNWVVGFWRGYLSGAKCRLAHGPADATATHCLLLQ